MGSARSAPRRAVAVVAVAAGVAAVLATPATRAAFTDSATVSATIRTGAAPAAPVGALGCRENGWEATVSWQASAGATSYLVTLYGGGNLTGTAVWGTFVVPTNSWDVQAGTSTWFNGDATVSVQARVGDHWLSTPSERRFVYAGPVIQGCD